MHANTSAAAQIEAARGRLSQLREQMGEPGALLRELSARFDESEWQSDRGHGVAERTEWLTVSERESEWHI